MMSRHPSGRHGFILRRRAISCIILRCSPFDASLLPSLADELPLAEMLSCVYECICLAQRRLKTMQASLSKFRKVSSREINEDVSNGMT